MFLIVLHCISICIIISLRQKALLTMLLIYLLLTYLLTNHTRHAHWSVLLLDLVPPFPRMRLHHDGLFPRTGNPGNNPRIPRHRMATSPALLLPDGWTDYLGVLSQGTENSEYNISDRWAWIAGYDGCVFGGQSCKCFVYSLLGSAIIVVDCTSGCEAVERSGCGVYE